MVTLNKIYTRSGDTGTTALATGERVPKHALRIESYGTVDETNAVIGMARLHDALAHQAEPLSAAQREQVQAHPARGAALLQRAGFALPVADVSLLGITAFVTNPDLPATNNEAERALRDAVIARARAAFTSGRSVSPSTPKSWPCSWAWPCSSTSTFFGSRTSRAVIAGTKVRERMKAKASAMMTVSAIGPNVLPSTPVSVSSGT